MIPSAFNSAIPAGIAELKELGIKAVIDLQSNEVSEEKAACEANGIVFYSRPLPGLEIITEPNRILVSNILTLIEDPTNQPIFIHCQHGKDRTGALVAEYRIDHGATAKEAIAEMRHYHNSWIEFGYRDAVEDFYEAKEKARST